MTKPNSQWVEERLQLGYKAIAVLHKWMRTEADDDDAVALGQFIQSVAKEQVEKFAEELEREIARFPAMDSIHASRPVISRLLAKYVGEEK